jgi:uncharacterized protein YjbI with pentapeptide repeats
MAGPHTNNSETPYPIWGFGPPSPEPDTKKLDALLASLNGSAERFQTLWFSFLGLTLYLAIAALATTHRNLLLGEPQTLPILNIKVELLPFYVIAPLLYLVFHFYLLMMLALLARTAAEFDKQLRTTIANEADRERYRAQVGNALFLQLLVGMKGERAGVNALLMGLIALITIVLAPLATLFLMQMMFLPYHHLRITWWHRAVVVADLVLIVLMTYRCFFPRGARKAPLVLGALSRKPRWATAMAFCALLAVGLVPLAYWLSFQQGRWAGEPRPSSIAEWGQWMAGKPPTLPEVGPDYAATEKGVVFGIFPDRLKLANETIVGEKTVEETKKEIISRGGDFVPTIKLDFRDLQAAVFVGADLREVSLNWAAMQGATLTLARLDGASLLSARLRGADLNGAQLQGDLLHSAQLQGANRRNARLQGANLAFAQLQGADLGETWLQGANLGFAQLQGADLTRSQLQAAYLDFAQLQGANLARAQVQGADLSFVQLQGSIIQPCPVAGATLRFAKLQGASLEGADLADTELRQTSVFRADIVDTKLSTPAIESVIAREAKPTDNPAMLNPCGCQIPFMPGLLSETPGHSWELGDESADYLSILPPMPDYFESMTPSRVENWRLAATGFAPDFERGAVAARFVRLKPNFQTDEQDDEDMARWSAEVSAQHDPFGAPHLRRLAAILGDLACADNGAPYVARAFVVPSYYSTRSSKFESRFSTLGEQLNSVRDRMKDGRKDPKACPGVAGFTESDWGRLDAIKPE